MEAKELRIGNLVNRINRNNEVHLPESTVYKVQEIGFDCVLCELGKNPAQQRQLPICAAFDISPIPLTEEWLVKFGFEHNEDDQAYTNDTLHVENRNNDRYIPEKTRKKLEGYFGVWFDDSPSFITDIKYVHQLQNLYHALTGKELEDKEFTFPTDLDKLK